MFDGAQFKFRSSPSKSPMQGVQFERQFEGQEERGLKEKSVETGVMTRPRSRFGIPLVEEIF